MGTLQIDVFVCYNTEKSTPLNNVGTIYQSADSLMRLTFTGKRLNFITVLFISHNLMLQTFNEEALVLEQ